jgi:predicted regulator of Ras-like GTPase activity (Roadblock/LC7/MglB family)
VEEDGGVMTVEVDNGVVDAILLDLLKHSAILAAVAVSIDGLVVGSAGVSQTDAEMAGALGASLVGAAERTARRLGAGKADDISVGTTDGFIHVKSSGDFAVLVFSEKRDAALVKGACSDAVNEIAKIIDGMI